MSIYKIILGSTRWKAGLLLLSLALTLLIACSPGEPLTPPGFGSQAGSGDPELDAFLTTIRDHLDVQLREFTGAGISEMRVVKAHRTAKKFARARVEIVPASCPLFAYPLEYNGELTDNGWKLFNREDTYVSFTRLWAAAHSAVLGGEEVHVPGTSARRVRLYPRVMDKPLRSELEGHSSPDLDALVGFFVCEKDQINWEKSDADRQVLEPLIEQVESFMRQRFSAGEETEEK
ncbi:MAG TPA: hypothetical protein EYH31_04210 [Anaerolineae bacterium]|nr:hypothetical protein [Anaerolineae bacterium]